MNRRSLHLLLLLISWTVSFAQTPGSSPASKDTVRCYTPVELRAIALKTIRAAECDTLLKVANAIIIKDSLAIKSQKKTIDQQDLRYITTEHLVDECVLQKEVLKKDLKKAKRRLVWTKVGWAATAVMLVTTTILAMVK